MVYTLQIESYQQGLDDTALNAILLKCETLDGPHYAGYIESGEGQWGSWIGEKQCQNVNQTRLFLNAVSLQVEPNQVIYHVYMYFRTNLTCLKDKIKLIVGISVFNKKNQICRKTNFH